MSQKSIIVKLLQDYIIEHPSDGEYIPSRSMCFTKDEHDWDFVFPINIDELRLSRPNFKVTLHNLLDGCQYIHSCIPGKDFLVNQIKWATVARIFTKAVQKAVNDGNTLPPTMTESQKTVFVFDYSKNVCLAKKPTQNKRREKDITNKSRLILPFDDPEHVEIVDTDIVPIDWKEMCSYGKYSRAINAYLAEFMYNNILFNDPKSQNFHIWREGVFKSVSPDHQYQEIEPVFNNMGEYDFFTLRYMDEIINQRIKEKFAHFKLSETSPIPTDILPQIYDFSDIVFRILSTDTDLLMLSLYFLEHLKFKHDIDINIKLPIVIIAQPFHGKNIIHVTNLFIALRYKLELDNNFGDARTMIRSFVISLLSCGNDLLPTPFNVVYGMFMSYFINYRSLSGQSLLTMNLSDKKPRYRNQCILNGKTFKMMYFLAYGEKLLSKDDKKEFWKYDNDLDGLEKFISLSITNKKIKDKRRDLQGYNNIKARLIVVNIMLYSIEHALRTTKGSKKSPLSDIMLPEFTHSNFYDQYLKKVDPKHHQKAVDLGMMSKRSCIFYSKNLNPNGESDDTMIQNLVELAENIYWGIHFGQYAYNRFIQENGHRVIKESKPSSVASCSTDYY